MCSFRLQINPFSCCLGSTAQKSAETKNSLNGNPNNIKNFSIRHPDTSLETSNVTKDQETRKTLDYTDYLTLVQDCFKLCKNPGHYLFIQHLAMDEHGKKGLTFNDYKGFMEKALKKNRLMVGVTLSRIENCNYSEDNKEKLKKILQNPLTTESSSRTTESSCCWPGNSPSCCPDFNFLTIFLWQQSG